MMQLMTTTGMKLWVRYRLQSWQCRKVFLTQLSLELHFLKTTTSESQVSLIQLRKTAKQNSQEKVSSKTPLTVALQRVWQQAFSSSALLQLRVAFVILLILDIDFNSAALGLLLRHHHRRHPPRPHHVHCWVSNPASLTAVNSAYGIWSRSCYNWTANTFPLTLCKSHAWVWKETEWDIERKSCL